MHEDCLTCYTFPNECSRPSHQCPDRQLRAAEAKAVAEDDYTFSIAKSEFVHHIADAYKAGVAAGKADKAAGQVMYDVLELIAAGGPDFYHTATCANMVNHALARARGE